MGKKANKTNEEKYEDLLESVSSLSDEEDTIDTNSEISSSSGLEGLQKRARELKRRFLLHKNHADRHNLTKICEYGLKVVKKITTATGKIDLSALEDDLDNAEVDLDLCEQEFQKDISRYDNLLQLLNEHELPKAKEQDFMLKIKNAKIDIYNATDSPEDLQSEYSKMVSHKEDNNKRRKELDRLRISLRQDIKSANNVTHQVKGEVMVMIDTELNIDNMVQFANKIRDIIARCIIGWEENFNDSIPWLDPIIDEDLLNDWEFYNNRNTLSLTLSDYDKIFALKSKMEKRIQYKKEHPIEIGDLLFSKAKEEQAEKWYKIAADKGDKYAMLRVYLCNRNDSNLHYLYESEKLGCPEACTELGVRCMHKKYFSVAASYFLKGAELGNPEAQYHAASIYTHPSLFGIVKKEDFKEAARWLMKAAEQGDVGAMETLLRVKKYYPFINKAKVIEMLRNKAREGDRDAADHLRTINESW